MTEKKIEPNPLVMLENMMLIRAYEEQNRELAAGHKAAGTCTSVGQEASAVGVVGALGSEDLILTNHRSSGHLLARGADPGRLLAEIMGKKDGYCKGKSGSLHISVKDLGVILTSTIVGGELSLVTGVGLSQSVLGKAGIVACFFGDGAACEGVFHESLNLAAVWNLPILYVCENNQWQAYVSRKDTMLTDHISKHGPVYGIESKTVDGNDVEVVYQAAREAVQRIRETGKPFLLETYTYRMRGHFEPDDQSYVNPQELAGWAARDPIQNLKDKLLNKGEIDSVGIEAIEAKIRQRLEDALNFAVSSPFPEQSELTTDVYA